MQKFYVPAVVCMLCCTLISNAQDRYWVGTSGGNWNNASNWSATSGGSGGATVPNGSSFNVTFNQAAHVLVDISPTITLNTLTVTGNATARLYTHTAATITLNSNNTGAPALKIDAGSRLEDSCGANVPFIMEFANGAKGLIDGTWYFCGNSSVTGSNGATFRLPNVSGAGNRIDINGTIQFKNNTLTPLPSFGAQYLFFNSGSEFWLDRNGGSSPRATWHSAANIRVTGVTTTFPSIAVPSNPGTIGGLIIDCPNMANDLGAGLTNHLIIGGDLQVLNTNNKALTLAVTSGTVGSVDYQVNGNFLISGNTIAVLGNPNTDKEYFMQVNGNFTQTGGTFLLRAPALPAVTITQPTTLKLKSAFNQTGGTFGSTCPLISTVSEFFVVELNGSSPQTVHAASGTIDNTEHQVTLRLNNAAGASLSSPLSVGKISWASSNKGVLTTTAASALTINNTDQNDPMVINGPGANAFVKGPIRRITSSTAAYRFPTGNGTTLRYCEVQPATSATSVYSAEYVGSAHPSTSKALPLTGISNEGYWNINKISGSDAAVVLHLDGSVPGASASDAIVVARFSGSVWYAVQGANGTALQPGNVTSGSVRSAVLSTFSPFTLAYQPASTLPITLLSFSARKINNNTAKVSWSVTDNSTPDRFEVLRSTDGVNFSTIGTVEGSTSLQYEFLDQQLPAAKVYYRLRMIDVDGTAELSRIVVLINNGEGGVLITGIMPSLVRERAKLNVSSGEKGTLQIVITDISGKMVQRQSTALIAGSQEVWLNTGLLSSGYYQVTGYFQDGTRTGTVRFLKQ